MCSKKGYFVIVKTLVVLLAMASVACTDKSCPGYADDADYKSRKTKLEKEINKIKNTDTLIYLYNSHNTNEITNNDKLQQMIVCNRLGRCLRDISDFSGAIKYNFIGLDIAKELNDTVEIIRSYNSLGTNFRRLGDFVEAMKYHNMALELVNTSADTTSVEAKKNKTVSLNGIGNISLTLGYYEDAKRLFGEALELEKSLKSRVGQAINYANIGAIYEKKQMYDSAMVYYEKSMEQNRLAKSNLGILLCYANFGKIYEKQNRLLEAEEMYQKSYQIANKEDDIWHKLISYISLGRLNIKLNRFDNAKKILNESMDMAVKIRASEHLVEINELFYEYYKKNNNFSKALYYFEHSKAYADSVIGEQNKNRFMETRIDFERAQSHKKEEFFINQHKQQVLKTRYITFLGIVFVVLLALVSILLRKLHNAEKRRADMLNNMNNIKNKFFAIISHDLKNSAVAINKSMRLLIDNISDMSDTDRTLFFSELSIASDAQVELLESLLNWAKIETGRMEFNPTVCDLKQIVNLVHRQLYNAFMDKRIELDIKIPDHLTVEADLNMLSIVLRNILSNAIKFSYPDKTIDIVATELNNGKILLSITDYGIGMTKDEIENCCKLNRIISIKGTCGETGTGLGLLVCREMLNKHNISLNIKSETGKGSTFSFEITKDSNSKPI